MATVAVQAGRRKGQPPEGRPPEGRNGRMGRS
jgi:hypothetical protein